MSASGGVVRAETKVEEKDSVWRTSETSCISQASGMVGGGIDHISSAERGCHRHIGTLDCNRTPGAPSHQGEDGREGEDREMARKCRAYTVADAIETKETQLADLGSQAEVLYTTGSLAIGTRRRVVV